MRREKSWDAQSFEVVRNNKLFGRDGQPPLIAIDPSVWQGKDVPPRSWLVPGLLIRNSVSILNGDGGVGKSLACQQLMTACALGVPWLGVDVPRIRSVGIFCEDDTDELWRRQAALNRHYGCDMMDVAENLRLVSRVGLDNLLMEFPRFNDRGVTTTLYDQMMALVSEWCPELIIIDTAADTFGGDEIRRAQVRAFINTLRQFALTTEGGVLLTQHPSNTGLTEGTGKSGSTAWNNSVRWRAYLMWPRAKEDEDKEASDERVLKLMKSNYSKRGSKVKLRWVDGAFEVIETEDHGGVVNRIGMDERVMAAFCRLVESGTRVAADKFSRLSFANTMAMQDGCGDISKRDLEGIKDRLMKAGRIVMVSMGPPSRSYPYLRPAEFRYPGERDESGNGGETR